MPNAIEQCMSECLRDRPAIPVHVIDLDPRMEAAKLSMNVVKTETRGLSYCIDFDTVGVCYVRRSESQPLSKHEPILARDSYISSRTVERSGVDEQTPIRNGDLKRPTHRSDRSRSRDTDRIIKRRSVVPLAAEVREEAPNDNTVSIQKRLKSNWRSDVGDMDRSQILELIQSIQLSSLFPNGAPIMEHHDAMQIMDTLIRQLKT